LLGEIDAFGAAVGGIGATLHPTIALKTVKKTGERDWRDVHEIGQLFLLSTIDAQEISKHLPLRPSKPELVGTAIEFPPHHSRYVVDDETESVLRTIVHGQP